MAVYLEIFFVSALMFLGLYLLCSQFVKYQKRIRYLEVTLSALIKHTGIEFNDTTLVPLEVHKAINTGHRLKAIRLYRKITGSGLKEATEVVDVLVKNT